jgi:hypothetical protein
VSPAMPKACSPAVVMAALEFTTLVTLST